MKLSAVLKTTSINVHIGTQNIGERRDDDSTLDEDRGGDDQVDESRDEEDAADITDQGDRMLFDETPGDHEESISVSVSTEEEDEV